MKGPTILLSFVQSHWWRNSTDFILHAILREIIIRWKKDTPTYCKCREGLRQPLTLSNIEYFCFLITRETAIIVSAISLLQLPSKCYAHLLCYICNYCINVFQIKTHEKGRCQPIQTLFQHKSFALIFNSLLADVLNQLKFYIFWSSCHSVRWFGQCFYLWIGR